MSADPAERAPALVEVRHLYKEFRLGTRTLSVLRDVNLTLHRGEMVSIVGASGAGKSTLLHCLGTLDLPTRGEILFEGVNITRLPPGELAAFRNRSIGFVFQFHHLLPEFSALENVMMPALIAREPTRAARERAEGLLEAVGLSERLRHRPGELSGGEQQRVAIARALVMQPKLLLADEPTGNLDTKTSDEVHELLFKLNEERQLTILVVTHNMELAASIPRNVRMADGQVLDEGLTPGPEDRDGGPTT
jgi:lipoprotein-releasing system ATP-binding protein